MEKLRERDFRGVLDLLSGSYVTGGVQTFAAYMVAALPELIPCDFSTYNELDLESASIAWVVDPPDRLFPDADRVFQQHLGENPYIPYRMRTRDGTTVKLSDLVTERQFRHTGLYQEFYRPLGVAHSMAGLLRLGRHDLVALALFRSGPDFSERDRLCLNLLRPHLVQVYRNARAAARVRDELALMSRGVEALSRGMLVVSRDGRIRRAAGRVERWLADYFGSVAYADRLPDALCRWIRVHEAREPAPAPPAEPLVVEREGRRLVVRRVEGPDESVLLFEEELTRLDAAALESLGLSRRESEVLTWVAEGKTNPVIATLLGLSPRTVQTHLERIFRKLGVETRTAAARRALEAARARARRHA